MDTTVLDYGVFCSRHWSWVFCFRYIYSLHGDGNVEIRAVVRQSGFLGNGIFLPEHALEVSHRRTSNSFDTV